MKNKAFIIVLSLILFSCEKDKDRQLVVENTDIPLIVNVLFDNEIYYEYTYNEANLVTEEKSKFHYTKHTYNDLNQVINSDFYWDISMASSSSSVIQAAMSRTEWVNPENTSKSVSHSFKYDPSGHLIEKSYKRTNDKHPDILVFTYNDERIVKATGSYNGTLRTVTNYYYDDKGNMIREEKFMTSDSGTQLTQTIEYEFDNMVNPYRAFNRLTTPGRYTNLNNITREIYTNNFDDPNIEKVQTIEHTYQYNSVGLPVKAGSAEYVYR